MEYKTTEEQESKYKKMGPILGAIEKRLDRPSIIDTGAEQLKKAYDKYKENKK